jgi:hypothetical protein
LDGGDRLVGGGGWLLVVVVVVVVVFYFSFAGTTSKFFGAERTAATHFSYYYLRSAIGCPIPRTLTLEPNIPLSPNPSDNIKSTGSNIVRQSSGLLCQLGIPFHTGTSLVITGGKPKKIL